MSSAYISCKILPGLFENEYYVMVNGSSACYVSSADVKLKAEPKQHSPVDGLVFGYLVEQRDHKALVQLTGEAVVGGLRTWVEREAVQLTA